ncbi:MAG: redoxin domain-containing protein [Leptolyngbya sp. SIO3F4]|nr:redoxin domain-containing protein [Leptolyngbya sp. SIO3F4]
MNSAVKLTSTDFRGIITPRFFKNFLPLPALNRFRIGQLLPDFELPVVGQRASIKLSSYRNKAIVVIAFTRIFTEKQYCPFCYPYLVSIAKAYKQFEQIGAQVLIVTSTDMRQSNIVHQDLGLTMPLLVDPSCRTFRQYGTGQALGAPLPAQFVIDRSGRLRFQHLFSFAHTNASSERLFWAAQSANL